MLLCLIRTMFLYLKLKQNKFNIELNSEKKKQIIVTSTPEKFVYSLYKENCYSASLSRIPSVLFSNGTSY